MENKQGNAKGQVISKGLILCFQLFQLSNKKFLPQWARAKIQVFNFIFFGKLEDTKKTLTEVEILSSGIGTKN